jgi:group I intron endonuclease
MTSYIYKITNLINGKTYVGQYTGEELIFNYYMGGGTILRKAIKKYGKENFKKEVIIKGSFNKELLKNLEIHYIQLYSPALTLNSYNIDRGGLSSTALCKRVNQYDLKGNFIKTYESIGEASDITNSNYSSIRTCLQNKTASSNSFIWLYEGQENLINDKLKRLHPTKEDISKRHFKQLIFVFDGNTWFDFLSTNDAAMYIGCNSSITQRAIKAQWRTYKHFLITSNKENIKFYGKNKREKSVVQKDLNNVVLKVWEKSSDAANYYGIRKENINTSIRRNGTCLNYKWTYTDKIYNTTDTTVI